MGVECQEPAVLTVGGQDCWLLRESIPAAGSGQSRPIAVVSWLAEGERQGRSTGSMATLRVVWGNGGVIHSATACGVDGGTT